MEVFWRLWGGVGGSTKAFCNYFEDLGGILWLSLETLGKFFCILQRFGSIFENSLVQHQAGRRPAVLQFFTSCYTCKDNVELAWGAPKIPKVWITCPQALFIPPPKWFTFIQMSSLSCRVTVHYAQLLTFLDAPLLSLTLTRFPFLC